MMENSNSNESEGNKTSYIYLDFNGKISKEAFQNQVFFRIANLHKKNPLVQVNDNLFIGTYDHSIGTNLFFEEVNDKPQASNIFEKPSPIAIKHFQSCTKVLSLQQVKVPQVKAKIPNETKTIKYNLEWDYNQLLQKFENGTLKIEDISLGDEQPQNVEIEEEKEETDNLESNTIPLEMETEPELDQQLENALSTEDTTPLKILEAEYEQLNILARRPMRRAASPELIAECDKHYKEVYEYHNIERQILQPRAGFKKEVLDVNENTLSDCIDIDRCIHYGLIPASSDFPRLLSKEEKDKLLTLENFDNLSLAGRYYVLQNIVSDLEGYVENAGLSKLEEKDENGRTPVQTLEIYKKLTEAVRTRIREIKLTLDENVENNKYMNV